MTEQEKSWEYSCNLIFAGQKITKFTITSHFQVNHPEISLELIVKLVKKLNGKEAELTNYPGPRKVFRFETIYQGKKYRLIFWYKDNATGHLWVRNCYRID